MAAQSVTWSSVIMVAILLVCVTIAIYYIMRYDHSFLMTKKEERKYAKNREEYFREFHRVIAPVVVMKVEGKDE